MGLLSWISFEVSTSYGEVDLWRLASVRTVVWTMAKCMYRLG